MSAQEQISKLQGLLARIQKNASRPRSAPVLAPSPTAPYGTPMAASPEPMPIAAPASFAPPSFDPVDELLGVSPEPSPLPVDIDVPLDSEPPAAEIAPPDALEAEPIPLVSVSTGQVAPPPSLTDDNFALESEVSEVRATPALREPTADVTVEAIAAEAEPFSPEELSEDDLVEVTEGTPPPATTDVDIDFDDELEEAPASSQRSRVASSMDEALAAAAAEQLDAEREVPLQTPPPESGPQAAVMPPGMAAPHAPDVDALLGGELEIPTRADSGMTARGPTAEQLGQTIELEEARGPSLELAEPRGSEAAAPAPIEELEAPLPGPALVGGYDENLQPPPEARDELDAHLRRQDDDIPPPPESLAQYPSVQPSAPELVPVYEAAPAGPEVVARPIPMGNPEAFGSVRESFRPSSFVELLDASLALNGD